MKQFITNWAGISLLIIYSIAASGCALTGNNTTANAANTPASNTVAATTTTAGATKPPQRKSLRDIADNAMASKGKLSAREINAILKTQSVCRPK